MHDSKVIDVLGGGAKVVTLLREHFPNRKPIGKHAIYMWKKRGIPDEWRYQVAELVEALPVDKRKGFHKDAFIRREVKRRARAA